MKKTYKSLTHVALGAFMCFSLTTTANAQQRGGRSSGGSSDGGSVQPQRSSSPPPPPSAPAPQPQIQRSSPPPQQPRYEAPAPQPQVQRSSPEPQIQRGAPSTYSQPSQQPSVQRGNSQGNSYSGQPQSSSNGGQFRPNANGNVSTQRGGESRAPLVFKPRNEGSTSRLYPNGGRGNSVNSGFNYRRENNNSYRSYPGLRFGRNYVSPRPRGFFYHNRGYYQTYYTPQLGYSINTLPYGYYPFYYGTDQYYYSDGLYYTQQEDNYTIVEPPIGAEITKLPAKAQAISINGVQYYELNGVYYQPITKDDGKLVYQIAGKDGELNTAEEEAINPEDLPQVGDLVDHLPQGFRILKLNGQRYYVSQEGYYFQDAEDTNGDKVFKIVGTPYDTVEN